MVSGNQSFKPFPSGAVGVRYAKLNVTAAVNAGDIPNGRHLCRRNIA